MFKNFFIISTVLLLTACSSKKNPASIEDRSNVIYSKSGPMEIVRVYQGDTVESIAQKYNMPAEIIAEANSLVFPYNIYSRTLMIPKGQYHKVKRGETFEKIARKYSVDVNTLLEANIHVGGDPRTGSFVLIPYTTRESKKVHDNMQNYDVMEVEEVSNLNAEPQKSYQINDDDGDEIIEKPIPVALNKPKEELKKQQEIVKQSDDFNFEEDLKKTLNSTEHQKSSEGDVEDHKAKEPIFEKPPEEKKIAAPISTSGGDEFAVTTPLNSPQFVWPLSGKVKRHVDDDKKDGITVFAGLGTPVRAAGKGKVIFADNDKGEYGNLVIIKHADGYLTAYAHNNQLLVKKGEEVNKGQTIAKVGKSGKVSKPQLYFSMRKGQDLINPEKE